VAGAGLTFADRGSLPLEAGEERRDWTLFAAVA
jgi:hypothetical protein